MNDDRPQDYFIWSNEHRAWWAPGKAGYVKHSKDAGRYSRSETIAICAVAIPGTSHRLGMLPELPVPVRDVVEVLADFHELYPNRDPEPQA